MTTIHPSPSPLHDGELIPLAEQLDNHDEFRPPATDALAGRAFRLELVERVTVDVTFASASHLHWRASASLVWGRAGTDAYEAVPLRHGVHAIVVPRLAGNSSALVILDEPARRVLINLTTFVLEDGTVRERTAFVQAGVGGPLVAPFERTVELIGKRVAHRYSTTHLFEHIYLNPNTYVFQGLAGPEAGVADVDEADYWKLGPDLYLLSWHERMQPFNGAVAIDLRAGRATGRLAGWDAAGNRMLQARTGSVATVLSETTYTDL